MRLADFFVPGFSNWTTASVDRLRNQHASETGLILAVHYPPWFNKVAWPVASAFKVQVTVDRKRAAIFVFGESPPVWVPLEPGTHWARFDGDAGPLVEPSFKVERGKITVVALWPKLKGLVILSRGRVFRLRTTVYDGNGSQTVTDVRTWR